MYEIIGVPKEQFKTKLAARTAVLKERPGFKVEAVADAGEDWDVRIATAPQRVAEFPPDFLKKKDDEEGSPEEEASESSEEEAEEDSGSDDDEDKSEDDDDSEGSSEDGEKKDKGDAGDAVEKIKGLIGEVSNLLKELGGHAKEVADAHDHKQKKLDDIADTIGDGAAGPEGMPPEAMPDVGPVPSAKPAGPGGLPRPARGLDKRRPGVPPGGVATFGSRPHEIFTHPGVNEAGNRISLTAAAVELENDPKLVAYEVVAIREDPTSDHYVAKLKLRK